VSPLSRLETISHDGFDGRDFHRSVRQDELAAIYASLRYPATFEWQGTDGECLIVSVDGERSTATIGVDRSFYKLIYAEADGAVEMELGGHTEMYPRRIVIPVPLGLSLLLRMPDLAGVMRDYRWEIED
jgi:hypothetical protein